ncbi:MAG TPA: hypothetical protein VNH53_03645 [Sphingomicrobium sp.]|nr:hypothetical protein [Sphingomicrobium sp.]
MPAAPRKRDKHLHDPRLKQFTTLGKFQLMEGGSNPRLAEAEIGFEGKIDHAG